VVERRRGLDSVVPRLVVDGFVQIFSSGVIGHFEPFHGGARPQAERGGHRHALAVERLQHARHRRCHSVDVKLIIAVGRFDPPGVEQRQRGVEDGAHVVQPGLQHVSTVDKLRVRLVDDFQGFFGTVGW